jgi:hypothetical protein
VFEDYVHAVLESYFNTAVEEQKYIGKLLAGKGGIFQWADYYWCDGTTFWIGDAKYKHLAKGQHGALHFSELKDEQNGVDEFTSLAGEVLSPADVRQLTVYAELVRRRERLATPPVLMLLYPFIGSQGDCIADSVVAWNGSTFWLMPVQVRAQDIIGNAIRFPALEYAVQCQKSQVS